MCKTHFSIYLNRIEKCSSELHLKCHENGFGISGSDSNTLIFNAYMR